MRQLIALGLACVFLACTPLSAGAAYAYDYGFNWSNSPFNSHNYYPHAQEARDWQVAHGYTTSYYSSGWASDIYNNMAAVSVMYLSGHSSAGVFPCWNSSPRSWWEDGIYYTSNISCLRGSTTHDGGHTIGSGWQECNHVRRLSTLANSPVKIMVFRGCSSGAFPDSLVYYAVSYAGMDFAGGFARAVWSYTDSGRIPGWYWTNRYWSSLHAHYYTGYSMERARDYVWAVYRDYYGYDHIVTSGNLNLLM